MKNCYICNIENSLIMKRFLAFSLMVLMALAVSCSKEANVEKGSSTPAGPSSPTDPTDPTDPVVSKGAYKHVVIVGVDGGGAFFKDTPTPRFLDLFPDHQRAMLGLVAPRRPSGISRNDQCNF